MKQLTFIRPGKLEWWDVDEPKLKKPTDAIVRPLAVARCDLDFALLKGEAPFRGNFLHFLRNHLPDQIGQDFIFRSAPFKGPFAFGHEGVGEVVEVGSAVKDFTLGDRVVIPFQVSCGTCGRCRAGLTNSCLSVPQRSMYGFGSLGGDWGGFLSDYIRVPFADFMLIKVPDNLSSESAASMSDNIPDAYRTISPLLKEHRNGKVLIVGGGAASVGLYAVGLAFSLGAKCVHYMDDDIQRSSIAKTYGATLLESARYSKVGDYDITVDASADEGLLNTAILSTSPGGTCTSVGIYYKGKVSIPILAMYGTDMKFVTGRARARSDICGCFKALDLGFCPDHVTTHISSWENAHKGLLENGPKVIVSRELSAH